MVLLGLLVLAASVGAAVSIAVSNTDSASFEVFGQTVTSLSPGGLLLLGLALGVAAVLGLWLMSAGRTRNKRRREANRQEEQRARSRVDELEEENIRLRQVAERREAAAGREATPGDYATGSETSVLRDDDEVPLDVERGKTVRSETRDATTRDVDSGHIYPEDGTYSAPPVTTPAFEDTERHQGNRVFGRRSK